MTLVNNRADVPVTHRRVAVYRRLHPLRRDLSAGLAGHQPRHRQGVHARGRMLVLRPVRRPLPNRRRHRQHALPAALTRCMDVPMHVHGSDLTCDIAGHRRRHRRPDGRPRRRTRPGAQVVLLEKANVKRSGALHGHGRAEQRGHPRPRRRPSNTSGDHHRQRRHRQPGPVYQTADAATT